MRRPAGTPTFESVQARSSLAHAEVLFTVTVALAAPSSVYVEVPGSKTRRNARSVGFVPPVEVLRAQTESVAVPFSVRAAARAAERQVAKRHEPVSARGWDYIPPGARVPRGESCLWGDYHLREVALYVQRILRDEPYYAFFS